MGKDVIIIGAGLTGLTTAYYLKKANIKFIILEEKNKIGGVINTLSKNDFIYEEGPNTGVIGNAAVVELFNELKDKCTLELASDNVNKRLILKNDIWHPLPMNLWQAISTPLFTTKDKFRILGEPFRKAGTNPHESLSNMVIRRLGKSFLDYAIDPFILGVYAGDPSLIIPKYALPKLYNLEQEYGSFIKGAFLKGFKKKTEQEKQVTRKVFSIEGGLSNLILALKNAIGEENIHTEIKNIKISENQNGFIVNGIKNNMPFVEYADKIVTTTGAYKLPDMLPFINKSDMAKLSSLHYTRVVEIAIGFKKWDGINLDAFGGLIPHKENKDLLGILFLSSLFKNRAAKDGALFSIFMGGTRNENIVELNDDTIFKIIEQQFPKLMKINKFNPDLFEIKRHHKAIPQYYADSGERFKTIELLQEKYQKLFIGGNLRNGIGMADRIQQGKSLAENIINLQLK